MGSATTTTDHATIRRWIEERKGRPSHVKTTGGGRDADGGILRIDFREQDENLEEIDWDTFFRTFDESDLAFLHQDKTDDGKQSRFFKFVSRRS
jgi:hypothetical protein